MPEASGSGMGSGVAVRWLAGLSLVLSLAAVAAAGLLFFITTEQLTANEEASRRQLRAYVGSETVQLTGFAAPNRLTVAHNLRNFGSTPANRLNYGWASKNEAPSETGAYPTVIAAPDAANGASLMPSASATYTDQLGLEPDAVADFARGKRVVTYFGVIHYTDAFGSAQLIHFCYVLTGEMVAGFRKGGATFATKCSNYNDGT